MAIRHPSIVSFVAAVVLFGTIMGCKRPDPDEVGKKILHMPLRSKVSSMDPIRGGTSYSSLAQSVVYEALFEYDFLSRPLRLIPRLLVAMPTIDPSKTKYEFTLKRGIYFQDDPCFPSGKGREIKSHDVFYSMKRMADRSNSPKGWWIYNDRIVGFDEFRAKQDERPVGAPFDADATVQGLEIIDDYRFRIHLKQPFPQFTYILAMQYTAVVPREAVEYYKEEFDSHPVGTGPFRLVKWIRGSKLIFEKNPTFREEYFPSPPPGGVGAVNPSLYEAAGKRIPFLDGIVMHVYEQDQPMWLKFRVKDLDYSQVPAEYFDSVYHSDGTLRPHLVDEGIQNYNLELIDFIYRGFNMEDPIWGGFGTGKWLRQAVSLATDIGEINDAFYNNTCVVYDGPIPPGLDGYKKGVLSPYRGPQIEKAKALLAKAGYPDGQGLPPLVFETSRGGNSQEQGDMLARQLKAVGIDLVPNYNSFPELDRKLKRKKAQFFSLAWGTDYPDAENNLALFYGPNEAPGSNNFNYKNPEYDALYEKIRTMEPSDERTAIYERMRDMVIEDVPAYGSMARVRYYVWNARLKNMFPEETWYGWHKYLDVEVAP